MARGEAAVPERGGPHAARPDVAIAVAEALCISIEAFGDAWPAFVRVVDDVGLTTRTPFLTKLEYWRRHDKPSPNDLCPWGSGLKWKRCDHAWRSARTRV